jgi:hypothetical protein
MFFIIIIVVVMLVIHRYIIYFSIVQFNSILLEYIFVVVWLLLLVKLKNSLIIYTDGLNLCIVIKSGSEGFELLLYQGSVT